MPVLTGERDSVSDPQAGHPWNIKVNRAFHQFATTEAISRDGLTQDR